MDTQKKSESKVAVQLIYVMHKTAKDGETPRGFNYGL